MKPIDRKKLLAVIDKQLHQLDEREATDDMNIWWLRYGKKEVLKNLKDRIERGMLDLEE